MTVMMAGAAPPPGTAPASGPSARCAALPPWSPCAICHGTQLLGGRELLLGLCSRRSWAYLRSASSCTDNARNDASSSPVR